MAFVQIIEFRTSDIERARQINDEWWRATEGKRTVRRELLACDHSDPSHCFAVVFFDSYESALENSNLPETRLFNVSVAVQSPMRTKPPSRLRRWHRDRARHPGTGLIAQPVQPGRQEPGPPPGHGAPADAQPRRAGSVAPALRAGQHDPGPESQPLSGPTAPGPVSQNPPLGLGQHQRLQPAITHATSRPHPRPRR
jgi:hypothetical protein